MPLAMLEYEVLKAFPNERIEKVEQLHREYRDAESRYGEHARRFASWADTPPEAHTVATLAESDRLRSDAREKQNVWQEAAVDLYGEW